MGSENRKRIQGFQGKVLGCRWVLRCERFENTLWEGRYPRHHGTLCSESRYTKSKFSLWRLWKSLLVLLTTLGKKLGLRQAQRNFFLLFHLIFLRQGLMESRLIFNSKCGQRWPWTPGMIASASSVLRWQACSTTPGLNDVRGLTHARQVFFHGVISPSLKPKFMSSVFVLVSHFLFKDSYDYGRWVVHPVRALWRETLCSLSHHVAVSCWGRCEHGETGWVRGSESPFGGVSFEVSGTWLIHLSCRSVCCYLPDILASSSQKGAPNQSFKILLVRVKVPSLTELPSRAGGDGSVGKGTCG